MLLGVHHVEVVVRRDGAVDELASIAQRRYARRARLRGDLYDTSNTAWSVARSFGGGREDTYRGNVVDTESRDDSCSYLLGIGASEGLQTAVITAEDDPIEYPQRACLTCDGGCTTAGRGEYYLIFTFAGMHCRRIDLGFFGGRYGEHYIYLWLVGYQGLEDLPSVEELKGLA